MSEYTPRHKPYAHQQDALDKMRGKKAPDMELGRRVHALRFKPRCGKSKTLLDRFGELELAGEVEDLFIFAPGGAYRTWETAIREHLSTDLTGRTKSFTWQSGAGISYKRELKAFLDYRDGVRIFLMNVEALSTVKEAREAAIAFLSARKSAAACDESTCLMRGTAARTKFVNAKLKPLADFRFILTGLITPRSPMDLYTQFEFLDERILGFRSFYAFRSRFAILKPLYIGGRVIQIEDGYRDLDELNARIEPYSSTVRFEDCYDMPPPQPFTRLVEMTKEQKKHYKEIQDFATTQLATGEHVTATIVIAQIMRLHQILCGHTVDESGKLHEIPEYRTKNLLDMIREYDGKVIIWCSYNYNVLKITEALQKEFGKDSVARFWGGNKDTREAEEADFKTNPECRFMVSTWDAGCRGRTWDCADLVIHYSYKENLEFWDQGNERPKKIGKMTPILYGTLKTEGTVEDKILKCLRDKINMASAINGENYREWLI